jgi:hypothetical protein
MKWVKRILIVLVIIIAIPLIVAMFAPKDFYSERKIVIERPKEEVYEFLRKVRNQDQFGVWQQMDPDVKFKEDGVDGTVGYTYYWDGKNTGKGSQKIIGLYPSDSAITQLDFGFGTPPEAFFKLQALSATSTEVTWGLRGESPYPLNFMNLVFDVGDDFETGLKNLKKVLEEK